MELQWLVASGGTVADLVDRIKMRGGVSRETPFETRAVFVHSTFRAPTRFLSFPLWHTQDSRGLRIVQTSLLQMDPSATSRHPFRTPLRMPLSIPLWYVRRLLGEGQIGKPRWRSLITDGL